MINFIKWLILLKDKKNQNQTKTKQKYNNESISICQNTNSTFHILNFIEKSNAYLSMYSAIFHIFYAKIQSWI